MAGRQVAVDSGTQVQASVAMELTPFSPRASQELCHDYARNSGDHSLSILVAVLKVLALSKAAEVVL